MFTEASLAKYSQTLIGVGLRVQPGDRVLIRSGIHSRELIPFLAREAYRSGAVNVDVVWRDPAVDHARFVGSDEALAAMPYTPMVLNQAAERRDLVLSIFGDDLDYESDADPERVATFRSALRQASAPFFSGMLSLDFIWSVANFPSPRWAKKVFPNVSEELAMHRLWESILVACRSLGDDPITNWDQHLDHLDARKAGLNDRRYRAIRYEGPGTDLMVGLSPEHFWNHPGEGSNGRRTVANIPTEEVSTSPDSRIAEGRIRVTKPIVNRGDIIEGCQLEFSHGKVVDAHAERGADALRRMLDLDEGSRRLGEVALVPLSSEIARQNLTWHDALFDENDASHLALGAGYPFGLRAGLSMTADQMADAGLNRSGQHVDIVIGSPDVTIYGVKEDGHEDALIQDGEWTFAT